MEKEITIGESYSIAGFAEEHVMKCIGVRPYDNKLIFETDDTPTKHWIRWMCDGTGLSGFLTGNLKQTYIIKKSTCITFAEEKVYKWFKKAISDVRCNIISESNLKINLIIAESMILQDHEMPKEIKESLLKAIKADGDEMVLNKQIEWEALAAAQVAQLPF